MTHWKEPPPKNFHKPGDYISSPGRKATYKICSYPFCRLYPGKGLEPHSFESAWVEIDGKFRKTGPNFLSYIVAIVYPESERERYQEIHQKPNFGMLLANEEEGEFLGTPFFFTDRTRQGSVQNPNLA